MGKDQKSPYRQLNHPRKDGFGLGPPVLILDIQN
jgi:hypothetical protein